MKSLKIYILIFVFCFTGVALFAQNVEKKKSAQKRPKLEIKHEIPEGMEAIQIGGSAQLIVPKGAKTEKVGAQIIVEGTKEYMSRRFSEMENRLETIEKRQEDLTKEIEALKKALTPQKENK